MEAIEFLIPNAWGSYLKDIFSNIDVENYNWMIGEMTEILGESNKTIFDKPIISGPEFLKTINLPQYYVIHAIIFALPKGLSSEFFRDFDDFSKSNYEIAVLIIDCTDVNIYAKDPVVIKQFMSNAFRFGFDEIRTLSNESEMRKYFLPNL
jgi:hypothetical protein